MKKIIRTAAILAVAALFCACSGRNPEAELLLKNTLPVERTDEMFVLTRDQLKPVDDTRLPVIADGRGGYIPSQADDTDGDGRWDELAFVYTLGPGETAELNVKWVEPQKYPEFPLRTNVRYGKMVSPGNIVELQSDLHGKFDLPRGKGYPYQMDGPAWENDKMGFRHYFDGRNNRDVFGKRVTRMALDPVGIRPDGTPGDTYHVLADWGRDIMSAAGSFGLGGIALQTPDSLFRLGIQGGTTDIIDSTRYTLLYEGPVRSAFRFDFYGWETPAGKVDLQNTVTIWAGQYGYENRLASTPLPEGYALVTGIVANFNDEAFLQQNYEEKYTGMITHDKQTYNKEYYMGMALIIPDANFAQSYHSPDRGADIVKTWIAKLRPAGGEYRYNVYAGWELGVEPFSNRQDFIELIDGYAERMCHPVEVTLR